MSAPAAISARALAYRYANGTEALRGLDLEVKRGSCHALLGPNGAGKTTFLSLVAGARRGAGGSLSVLGAHPGARATRRRLAYAPQQPAVAAWLSVRENLAFFAALNGLGRRDAAARAEHWMERLGLVPHARARAQELSGGTLKRLSLGAALIADPELLVVDEATAGVDPQSREAIAAAIGELTARGATVLYSTHHLGEVERLCDAVTMIDGGRTLETGPVEAYRAAGLSVEERFFALTGRELRE